MRQVSLREFRTRGAKALTAVPSGETVLLSGQQGPAYFLIPVLGDVVVEEKELRCVIAKANLRENWRIAQESGLNHLSEDDINQEIREVRKINYGQKNT